MITISPITTDPEIQQELGRRLRDTRRTRRLGIQEVAKQTGLSRRTVYRAERGDNPTLVTLLRLFRLYGRLPELETLLHAPEISPMALIAPRPARARGGEKKKP
jgi:transcriptional regulator with XRE-family HTH domain